jgi:hypothetical protein
MYQADDWDSTQFDVKGTINLAGELPPIIHGISIDGPGAGRRDRGLLPSQSARQLEGSHG